MAMALLERVYPAGFVRRLLPDTASSGLIPLPPAAAAGPPQPSCSASSTGVDSPGGDDSGEEEDEGTPSAGTPEPAGGPGPNLALGARPVIPGSGAAMGIARPADLYREWIARNVRMPGASEPAASYAHPGMAAAAEAHAEGSQPKPSGAAAAEGARKEGSGSKPAGREGAHAQPVFTAPPFGQWQGGGGGAGRQGPVPPAVAGVTAPSLPLPPAAWQGGGEPRALREQQQQQQQRAAGPGDAWQGAGYEPQVQPAHIDTRIALAGGVVPQFDWPPADARNATASPFGERTP